MCAYPDPYRVVLKNTGASIRNAGTRGDPLLATDGSPFVRRLAGDALLGRQRHHYGPWLSGCYASVRRRFRRLAWLWPDLCPPLTLREPRSLLAAASPASLPPALPQAALPRPLPDPLPSPSSDAPTTLPALSASMPLAASLALEPKSTPLSPSISIAV